MGIFDRLVGRDKKDETPAKEITQRGEPGQPGRLAYRTPASIANDLPDVVPQEEIEKLKRQHFVERAEIDPLSHEGKIYEFLRYAGIHDRKQCDVLGDLLVRYTKSMISLATVPEKTEPSPCRKPEHLLSDCTYVVSEGSDLPKLVCRMCKERNQAIEETRDRLKQEADLYIARKLAEKESQK